MKDYRFQLLVDVKCGLDNGKFSYLANFFGLDVKNDQDGREDICEAVMTASNHQISEIYYGLVSISDNRISWALAD
jgi:hypothetical protein